MKKIKILEAILSVLFIIFLCVAGMKMYENKHENPSIENQEVAHNISEKLKNIETPEPGVRIEDLNPGDIIRKEQMPGDLEAYFKVFEIKEGDSIYNRIIGKSYRVNPYIGLDDLRYIKLPHYNFDHQIQVGELIVNTRVCDDIINIFKELFEAEYEIESIYLVDDYWTGDGTSTDTASIEVNNSSAFNFREITGGKSLSNHAYGCAIDINPQQNPYITRRNGKLRYAHENSSPYIDRNCGDPHVIVKGDLCCSTFEKYGFSWGGDWTNPVDYQHFEKKLY